MQNIPFRSLDWIPSTSPSFCLCSMLPDVTLLHHIAPATQIPRHRIDRPTPYDRHEPCNRHIRQWHPPTINPNSAWAGGGPPSHETRSVQLLSSTPPPFYVVGSLSDHSSNFLQVALIAPTIWAPTLKRATTRD